MTSILNTATAISVLALMNSCATVTPPDLIEARNAYTTASSGPAATTTPTELYDATKVLDKADAEVKENGETDAVHDLSYVALRKIQLAEVKTRTEKDRQRISEAVKQGVVVRDSQVKQSQAALADTREQLNDERNTNANTNTRLRAANAAQGKELEKTAAQLETERLARQTAEAKLAGAMKDLATIAAIREEARGLVITLNGSVLFPSGKYALLETAKTKLDQVAEAIKAQADERTIVVEGHTDSMGTDAINQPLSLNRAASVRDYLVGRGVPTARISAVGIGSTRPLLNNTNAENRANNRRVEIIIQPAQLTNR